MKLKTFCKDCQHSSPELHIKVLRLDGKIACSSPCAGIPPVYLCCKECQKVSCQGRQALYEEITQEYRTKFNKYLKQRLMMEKLDA